MTRSNQYPAFSGSAPDGDDCAWDLCYPVVTIDVPDVCIDPITFTASYVIKIIKQVGEEITSWQYRVNIPSGWGKKAVEEGDGPALEKEIDVGNGVTYTTSLYLCPTEEPEVDCCDLGYTLNVDEDDNPSQIPAGSSGTLVVADGCPPYRWFMDVIWMDLYPDYPEIYFEAAETDIGQNTLYCTNNADTLYAIIAVGDACNDWVEIIVQSVCDCNYAASFVAAAGNPTCWTLDQVHAFTVEGGCLPIAWEFEQSIYNEQVYFGKTGDRTAELIALQAASATVFTITATDACNNEVEFVLSNCP